MQDRNIGVDFYKAIGICLMVASHASVLGITTDMFIHAFHMPMFFFISGYLYKSKDCSIRQSVKRKTNSLIIPYISFGIINSVFYIIIYGFHLNPLLHLISFNTCNLPIAGALWFLTAFFFSNVTYLLISKKLLHENIKTAVVLVLMLLGLFWDLILPSHLTPFAINAGLVGLGLMHLGYLFRRSRFDVSILPWWLSLLMLCLALIGILLLNGPVNMRTGIYHNPVAFVFNAVIMSVLLLKISERIAHRFKTNTIFVQIALIGERSLVFLGLNQLVLLMAYILLGGVILTERILVYCVFVISVIVLQLVSSVIVKRPFSYLLGKL